MVDGEVDSASKMSREDASSAVQRVPGTATRRDSGLTALILGCFAAGWFSWTPEALTFPTDSGVDFSVQATAEMCLSDS